MRKIYSMGWALAVVLSLCSVPLFAQTLRVSGVVTDETGQAVPGVSILEKGTSNGVTTDNDGRYALNVADGNPILVFSFIGYATQEIIVGNRTSIDVHLALDVTSLEEVVVTGYATEKKADIIGSVSVVNSKDLLSTPSANLTTQLQGRAAGVVVSSSGEPGAAARVRIRGFSSFGSNDPLYVIDGVPTEDPSRLNPQDIESMQILKDATSASIYGSRAANGVIVITTKRGKVGTSSISYDGYYGVQKIPDSTLPDLLNTSQYAQYLQKTNLATATHPVFGTLGNPTIPDYIILDKINNFKGGVSASDPRANASLYTIDDKDHPYQILKTSTGTNWHKAILQPGIIQSHQISASGGTDKGTYNVGFNYFDQQGTFKNTSYTRYTVRANTVFNAKSWLRIGENLQVSFDKTKGGNNKNEGGAWAMAYRMVPYIPVNDINGGFGGNGVGNSGNGSNPVADLTRSKDNKNYNYKIFGNIFGEVDLLKDLTFRTSFGVDYGTNNTTNYVYRTYERSENVTIPQLIDQSFYNISWTWTNTLKYSKTIGAHDFKVLAGTEAIKSQGKGIGVNTQNFDIENPLLMSLGTAHYTTPQVYNSNMNSTGGSIFGGTAFDTYQSTLASMFARIDYQFQDKYIFNATVRRDGSSKFGTDNRYAVFPAFGLGWRLSEESFMKGLTWLSDLKIRGGWGQLGSQKNVPRTNAYTTFQSTASNTNYDISGSNSNLAVGFGGVQVGSNATKWETTTTTNVGIDASLLGGKIDLTVNYFKNETSGLLVQRQRNGLEPTITQPFINVGTMNNKGIDLMLTNRGEIIDGLRYELGLTFTHYVNTVTKLDNSGTATFDINLPRLNQGLRTIAGQPISQFYGYQIDGFYQNAAEVASGPAQPGKVVGSWRYKDLNGDGTIDDKDKTYIGSPHPKFQTGINLSLMYKNFDVTAFFFWNYGNKIYNYTKYYTDLGVFVGGLSTRVLNDSWTPENPNAKLPLLAPGAASGFTSFTSSTSNSYYVESGSYLRLRNLQIGYTVPRAILERVKIQKLRIYAQGQNLFTITKYSGPDPDMNIQSGNNGDTYLGVDQSGFPNSRQYLLGLNLTF